MKGDLIMERKVYTNWSEKSKGEIVMKVRKAFTHAGIFHADDVFASALLKILYPEIEIIRGFQVPNEDIDVVFDIGGGVFDHHQPNAPTRTDGTPFAAFGLLWRNFGHMFVSEKNVKKFDEEFIKPLDKHDNTGCGHPIARVISSFNPNWDEKISTNDVFAKAVEFAKTILEREFIHMNSVEKAENIVKEALSKNEDGIVILDQFVPWQETLIPCQEAKFVVYPALAGGWNAQQIPTTFGRTDAKVPFPSRWRGTSEAFKQETGGTFCHPNGFLCAFGTKDSAISACRIALEESKKTS